MTTKNDIDIVDAYQGSDGHERPYGYIGIEDQGGYFFTWLDSLEATLDSLEADEVDPPKHDFREAAREALTQAMGDRFDELRAAANGEYPSLLCRF